MRELRLSAKKKAFESQQEQPSKIQTTSNNKYTRRSSSSSLDVNLHKWENKRPEKKPTGVTVTSRSNSTSSSFGNTTASYRRRTRSSPKNKLSNVNTKKTIVRVISQSSSSETSIQTKPRTPLSFSFSEDTTTTNTSVRSRSSSISTSSKKSSSVVRQHLTAAASATRPPPTTSTTNNVVDRLYKPDYFKERDEKLLEQKVSKELIDCTFSPSLSSEFRQLRLHQTSSPRNLLLHTQNSMPNISSSSTELLRDAEEYTFKPDCTRSRKSFGRLQKAGSNVLDYYTMRKRRYSGDNTIDLDSHRDDIWSSFETDIGNDEKNHSYILDTAHMTHQFLFKTHHTPQQQQLQEPLQKKEICHDIKVQEEEAEEAEKKDDTSNNSSVIGEDTTSDLRNKSLDQNSIFSSMDFNMSVQGEDDDEEEEDRLDALLQNGTPGGAAVF